MTPPQIRAKLEQFAESGSYTANDLARLNQSWLSIRDTTPQSYHAVINDRVRALRTNLDLPELPSFARLIIARDLAGENEILAINLDDRSQCAISTTPAYQFIPDLIGLDQALADRYTEGYPVAVGMTAENWQLWVENFELAQEDSDYVWLTASLEGWGQNSLSALCLTDKCEVAVPRDEMPHFYPDCIGLNESQLMSGQGVVCRMSVENWAAWLEHFEVASLPAETAALLSA